MNRKRKMENSDDIINFIAGNIDTESKERILSEIDKDSEKENVYKKVKVASAFLASTGKMQDYKIENSYKKLQARIHLFPNHLHSNINRFLKYAAILIVFLSIVPFLYLYQKEFSTEGAKILKYTSVVANYRQISKVILPDSSVIWLNSGTILTYNNNYSVTNRDLTINGEAYLNVRKNRKYPLIVSCKGLKVKVLGTKFNVAAYPEDDKVTIALESGLVELTDVKGESIYKLKPGESAQYDTQSKNIVMKKPNVKDFSAWKDGLLVFRDSPMKEVLKKLERKFNVDIVAEDPRVFEPLFNAKFKDENLMEILDYIHYSCHFQYEILNNTGIVTIRLY